MYAIQWVYHEDSWSGLDRSFACITDLVSCPCQSDGFVQELKRMIAETKKEVPKEVLLGEVSVYSVSIMWLKFSETTSNQRHVGMINPLRALWAASSHQFLQVREIRAAGPWDHCYDTRKHPGLWPTRYVAGRLWYPDYKMTLPDVNIQIMIIISSRFIEWWYKSIQKY